MKRLLLPLIAALALPTSVNAESVWLLIRTPGATKSLEKIEMSSIKQCDEEIGKLLIRWNLSEKWRKDHFACVTGK